MKTIIFVTAMTFACNSYCQAPAVLLEACNAIQDSNKRLECLKAAMGVGVAPSKAPATESLERALTGLQSSLDVGISYVNYQSALLDVAKELAIFKKAAAAEFAGGIEQLEQSIETYKDAGTFWEASIRFYSHSDNSLAYFGGLPVNQVGLGWMVSKHDLPTRNADLLGFHLGVPTDLGRSSMWSKAKTLGEAGLQSIKVADRKPVTETLQKRINEEKT
jgi:hypothetical protein